MAETLSVTKKGEQRDGEEIFVIVLSRGGVERTLEFTRSEILDMRNRELVVSEIATSEIKLASIDEVDSTTHLNRLKKSLKRAQELRAVLEFMEE